MHTITVQINDEIALKTLQDLEHRHSISIIGASDLDKPSLPGAPLSLAEFEHWIKDAAQTSTLSLTEAKERWANKRKQLRSITK